MQGHQLACPEVFTKRFGARATPNTPIRLGVALVLASLLATACGTTTGVALTDEERCVRFSGTWNRVTGQCGGGGP